MRLRPNWSSTSEPEPESPPEPPASGTRLVARRTRSTAALTSRLRPGVSGEKLDDLLADPTQIGTQLHQDLRSHALALADQPQQDVLRADVVMPELQRLAQRELQDLLGAGSEGNVATGRLAPWPMSSSTWLRTAFKEMPSDSRPLAATPSPSWISPSRMCSVPM